VINEVTRTAQRKKTMTKETKPTMKAQTKMRRLALLEVVVTPCHPPTIARQGLHQYCNKRRFVD